MTTRGKIHAIAHCRNCDWTEEDFKTSQRKGNEHFKKTGHIVDVEVGK